MIAPHILLHLARLSATAMVGAVLGLYYGRPHEDQPLTFWSERPSYLHTFHSAIGGNGHTYEQAFGYMLLLGALCAVVGFVAGQALVAAGAVTKEQIGSEL